MQKTITRRLAVYMALLLAMLLALVGCGGSSAGGGGGARVDFFLTDDITPDYSGVWVKVYKLEAVPVTGSSFTVFESTDGVTVNLRQLNDGASRFLLLGPSNLPTGTYRKLEIVLNRTVDLVAVGTGAKSTALFPASLSNSDGNTKIDLNLLPNITVPGVTQITVDFDLRNWTVASGVITPFVRLHDGAGFSDGNRHEPFEFKGLIGSLSGTAPVQTFQLTRPGRGTISVTTSSSTAIRFEDGVANALANGQKAEIYGTFDPATRSLGARQIKIEDGVDEDEAKVIGPVLMVVDDSTFKLTPRFTRGFAPGAESVTIATTVSTRFRGRRGSTLTQAQFFASLSTVVGLSSIVEAEGIFDPVTNTLTAKSVHLEDEPFDGQAEAKGNSSAPNSTLGTFSMSVIEHSGFTPPGGDLPIKVIEGCTFQNSAGGPISRSLFFVAIGLESKLLDVKGTFREGQVFATRVRLR